MSEDGPPLRPKAVAIAIALWFAGFALIALVLIPGLFALCAPAAGAAP